MALLFVLAVMVGFFVYHSKKEQFWGGVINVPYAGQPVVRYDRTGINATTDRPTMLVNINSPPINQCFAF